MAVGISRPDVSDLTLTLFGRSIHPELFGTRATAELARDGYHATLRLGDAGHCVSFRVGGLTVTEVLAPDTLELPRHKRLFGRKLRGNRTESRVFDGGLRYQGCSQSEQLDAAIFARLHEELSADCLRAPVSFRFAPGNRLNPSPLSLIRVDVQADGLLLHAFHTFPESLAVVRTQSLFEL